MDNSTPTDPVAQVETPSTQAPAESTPPVEVPTEEVVQPQATVSPEQDFLQAYNALVAEKGYELRFEAKPVLTDGVYDFSHVYVQVLVAKKA